MEEGKGIVYSVPKTVLYDISVQEIPEFKTFTGMVQTAIIDGKKFLLHNEVSFTFKIVDGKVDIINGWHTGTEDFTFSKAEGDNCEEYIEEYNPGLLKQLNAKLKEKGYNV